jgi:DNA-binding beta-propeller fold protein YncE
MLTAGAYIGGRTSRSRVIAALLLASISIVLVWLLAVVPTRASAAVESGALSQLNQPFACIGEVEEEIAKCGKSVQSGLSFAYEVQVSPDGRNAYSVAVQGDLIEYSRDPANGALSVIGCFSSKPKTEPACETNAEMEVPSIESPAALAISPDGSSVYVVGQGAVNDLVTFGRNSETGLLTKIGCVTQEATLAGCTTGAKGLELPYGVTVSPDGENVYVTSFTDQAIAEFKRDTTTGELTQLTKENNCISDTSGSECGTITAIGLKEAIGVVASGKDVYVGAGGTFSEGDVAAFERGVEGALTQLHGEEACIGATVSGCAHSEHLEGTEDLVVSPDGNNVYGTSTATNSVIELKRTGTGALEQLASPNECVTTEASFSGCTEVKEIRSPVGVAASPDGSNVYVSSRGENSVAGFARGGEGELTQLVNYPCVTEAASGCEPATSNERVGLKYARRLTVSSDGTNVYVAGQNAHAISAFTRAVRPVVTSLSNGGGVEAGGNEITIEGSGFVEGATVEFVGAGSASEVHVHSAGAITAIVPPGHGIAYVVVATPAGTSAAGAGSEYVYGRLGGLNIAGYCEGLGYLGDGSGATALLREGHVEGPEYAYENWACVNSSGVAVPIAAHGSAPSMDNACAVAFPNLPSHAQADNPDNAFSWTCYEGAPAEEAKGGSEGPTTSPPLKRLASELISFPLPVVIPPPVLAKTGNVAPVKGTVLVELLGTKTFVPLASLTQIPFGTVIEATNGTVSVTTANPNGTTQTGQFFGGQFILTQGKNGQVLAKLNGGNFSVCPTARERAHRARVSSTGPVAQAAASGKHVVRKLWADAHGKFSTEGNYAAGAVQGTEWLTEDLCEGTLIRVTRDKVAVTNLVNHKRVEVKTGHKYLAKAP